MIRIKKITFFIIKSALIIVALLTLVLFLYTVFFYNPSSVEKKTIENQIDEEEKQKLNKLQTQKKISDTTQDKTETKQIQTKPKKIKIKLKDGLFATVGNKAITRSDLVNEIKIILILNNMIYSDDKRNELQKMAAKSIIQRTIKQIEINKNDFLKFNKNDLKNELNKRANQANMDLPKLKEIFIFNGLDFSIIENNIITELLWNSLIYYLYRNRVSVNIDEIEEQLKQSQNKKEFDEFLISEIVIKSVEKDELKSRIEEIKKKIEVEGFESVAMSSSISQTAIKGGDLGWLNENEISKKFKSIIFDTPIGALSKPILLNEGILIFKVRNKRKIIKNIDLEQLKNQLVNSEKTKMLNMYSRSHFDNLKRSISIKYFND